MVDIFLVGKPNDSLLGNAVDKWYEDRVIDLAKFTKLYDKDSKRQITDHKSALKYLEDFYKVPYDQTGLSDSGKEVLDYILQIITLNYCHIIQHY